MLWIDTADQLMSEAHSSTAIVHTLKQANFPYMWDWSTPAPAGVGQRKGRGRGLGFWAPKAPRTPAAVCKIGVHGIRWLGHWPATAICEPLLAASR